jgi:isopentenyl diphosphate isomerase/L-lactate dehydrogenase-like FMN-dependent dehydrogenase
MDLTEIYAAGKRFFAEKEFGYLLDYAETGFIRGNDRRMIDRYTFRQRCIDAQEARTAVEVLGIALKTPVIMSAMTMPIPAIHSDALLQLARGLKAAGSLMWTGTPIPKNLVEIIATGVPLVANVKPLKDRRKMQAEIDQIVSSGVEWLGLEIDAGVGTKVREREMGFECLPLKAGEIAEIRKRIPMPLACKGILSWEDAVKCLDAGAEILVVSNHGGHTLDYLPHPFQVMGEITAAVKGRATIVVDGGFRRGSDVLKGLAFGASLIGLGRPILHALAAGGETGVADLINGITRELRRLMTMVAATEPSQVSREILIDNP